MALPPPDSWFLNPLVVAAVTAAAVVPAARLRSAGVQGGELRWRSVSLAGGIALLVVACLSPVATLGAHYLLTAHLVQNLLIMGCAPPLLLLALPRDGGRAGRLLRVATNPAVALIGGNAVFIAWHVAPVYDASLRSESLYALQQVTLLAVALAFWAPIAGPSRRMQGLVQLGYILLATIPQTFTGLIYAVARHPLYAGYASAPRVGMSALADQQIGGACLALLSKIALFVAFSVVFWRLVSEDSGEQGDDGGGPGRGGHHPKPGPGLPAWVTLLDDGTLCDEPQRERPRRRQGSEAPAAT